MTDKVEWEVVDSEPDGNARSHSYADFNEPPQRPPTPKEILKASLGPWWRWKLAGIVVVGAIVLMLIAAVAGVLVVTAIAFALLSILIMRVRSWLSGASTSLQQRP